MSKKNYIHPINDDPIQLLKQAHAKIKTLENDVLEKGAELKEKQQLITALDERIRQLKCNAIKHALSFEAKQRERKALIIQNDAMKIYAARYAENRAANYDEAMKDCIEEAKHMFKLIQEMYKLGTV